MFNKLLASFGYQRKESRAYSALIQLGLDMPVWTPRDYEQLTKAGYQLNSDVYACVNLIARSAKQIPWMVKTKEEGTSVANNHPLLKLLQRPNERDTESDFKEAAIAYQLLSGNTYIERSGGTENTAPVFLYAHRPDRMRVIKGTRRQIVAGYVYTAGATPVHFQPWEILHLRSFNPLDDFYGFSPIEAAAYLIDGSNEAAALYKKLLQKGYPPGAVMVKGVDYSDEQVQQLKRGLKRSSEAGEILLLQDATWQEMGFKPVDASIFEGKRFTKRDIAAVFGVPSGMIGDTQVKTYANSREERRSLYTEAVIPALTKLRDGLNNFLSPLYGGAFIDFDKDSIDALAEDRDTQATRVKTLFEVNLIKRNEARAELKYDEVPEDEDGYFSEVSQSAGGDLLSDGGSDQGAPQAIPTMPMVGTRRPQQQLPSGRQPIPISVRRDDPGSDRQWKAFNLLSEAERDNHWKTVEARRELWYIRIENQVGDRFSDEQQAVVKAFADGGESAALRMVNKQEPEWNTLYRSIVFGVAEDFGRRTLASIKSNGYSDIEVKFELDLFTRTILEWLASEGAKRVVGILEVTRAQIKRELMIGVAAGESVYTLSKRLEGMYSAFSNVRAERVARTETVSASNLGSQTAALATNLPLEKEWIATLDDRTRDAHADAHGQRRSIKEPYIVMGQKLMYPGDAENGATADNVVMCRCSESYRVKRG